MASQKQEIANLSVGTPPAETALGGITSRTPAAQEDENRRLKSRQGALSPGICWHHLRERKNICVGHFDGKSSASEESRRPSSQISSIIFNAVNNQN